jgi:hypothetical protein
MTRKGTGVGRRFGLAAIAGAMSVLIAASAAAVPTVELFFTELNGAPISPTGNLGVLPGDLIRVEAVITTGDIATRGFDISLDYDGAGTGRLSLDDTENILPPAPAPGYAWITQNDPGLEVPGRVRFSSILPILDDLLPAEVVEGLQNSTYAFGWAEFTVTSEILSGPATLFPSADYVIGLNWDEISGEFEEIDITASYAFNGLTLTPIPEPSTALLVALGLLVLGTKVSARSSV